MEGSNCAGAEDKNDELRQGSLQREGFLDVAASGMFSAAIALGLFPRAIDIMTRAN